MSTFLAGLFGKSVPPNVITTRKFPVDDPANVLYPVINWKKSVIAGSYALKQFTGDSNWNPADVDVMVGCADEGEFFTEVSRVVAGLGGGGKVVVGECILRDVSQKMCRIINPISGQQIGEIEKNPVLERQAELFHDKIGGTCNLNVRSTNGSLFKTQMVYLKTGGTRSVQNILTEITDVPSCVNYHVETINYGNGKVEETRIFHCPEKGLQSLMTGIASPNDVCASRREKYTQRGYSYTGK